MISRWRLGLGGCLISAIGAWYLTSTYKDAKIDAMRNEYRIGAEKVISTSAAAALRNERDGELTIKKLEIANGLLSKSINQASDTGRRLAANGMRDPHGTKCETRVSTSTSTADNITKPTADGRLSAETTELLLSESRRADEAAAYGAAGFEYAQVIEAWRQANK